MARELARHEPPAVGWGLRTRIMIRVRSFA